MLFGSPSSTRRFRVRRRAIVVHKRRVPHGATRGATSTGPASNSHFVAPCSTSRPASICLSRRKASVAASPRRRRCLLPRGRAPGVEALVLEVPPRYKRKAPCPGRLLQGGVEENTQRPQRHPEGAAGRHRSRYNAASSTSWSASAMRTPALKFRVAVPPGQTRILELGYAVRGLSTMKENAFPWLGKLAIDTAGVVPRHSRKALRTRPGVRPPCFPMESATSSTTHARTMRSPRPSATLVLLAEGRR